MLLDQQTFDRYRHYSFHKSLRRITENLQRMEDFGSATPVFGLKRKEIQDEDLANAPALDVEQSLDERLAVLERQTAALLNATQRLELSTSRMKRRILSVVFSPVSILQTGLRASDWMYHGIPIWKDFTIRRNIRIPNQEQ